MARAPPCSRISREEVRLENLGLTIIPGLPNDLASLILAFLPYSHQSRLKLICRSWRLFFANKNLIPLRRALLPRSALSQILCIFPEDPSISSPYLFDPRNLSWYPLPPSPCNPNAYGLCNFTSTSIGSDLYVIGGSCFNTRSYPTDRPGASSSASRFNFVDFSWESLSPMLTPRGSFACASVSDKIVVAGGGSRHWVYEAAGSRTSAVEMYDIGRDEWVELEDLPRFRAGCVGFLAGRGEDRKFWVMGGYGESRTVSGVFPVDEYYKDSVVMELKNGCKWRELGDTWEEGERRKLGKIAVLEDDGCDFPAVFMLDSNDIFRYDMDCNQWSKETTVPRKASDESSVGFVALDGKLHVLSLRNSRRITDSVNSKQKKRSDTILLQIYHPRKKRWRSIVANSPFSNPINFKAAVMCTIAL